jgi:phage tail-like protein
MKSRTLLAVALGGALLAAAAIGAWTSASHGATPNDSPITAARFGISVDGVQLAVFSELAGIASGIDAGDVEYVNRDGTVTLKLPGKRTPPTVTLTRGLTRSLELSAWHELVMLGDLAAARKNAVLTMYDVVGEPVARYHLENAWPAKLEIGGLKADAGTALMETVTLVCDRIQRVSP